MAQTDNKLNSISTVGEAISVLEGHYAKSLKGDIPFTLETLRVVNRNINSIEDRVVDPQIALSASSTTDGMDITVSFNDSDGDKISDVILFELWISEAATGIGITADTFSGDFSAGTGSEHEEITAKKHYRLLTDTSGDFVATLVDSANPADQYVVIPSPTDGVLTVSEASGTNWEGA